jgi:hypothetical protein
MERSKAEECFFSEGSRDVSDAEGLSSFKTPCIDSRGGLIRAEPSSPLAPITDRQATQRELVAYSMPFAPNRQLTKQDLENFDYHCKLPPFTDVYQTLPS